MKGRTETTMTKATQVALIVRKRTQLLAKLRAEAKRQGVTALNAQHQFAFDMFLTRMFSHSECPWVLKGGTSLLLRLGSGRRSEDIDLARNTHLRPAEALQELKHPAPMPYPDPICTLNQHIPRICRFSRPKSTYHCIAAARAALRIYSSSLSSGVWVV